MGSTLVAEVEEVAAARPRGGPSLPPAGPPKVLLVDDEEAVLAGLRRHLQGRFSVQTATDVATALQLMREAGPFAVVMTDMRMPGQDGVALLRTLRDEAPHTVRMLLTGYADVDVAIDAVNEGNVFRFLCKPCEPAAVVAAVEAGVEQHRLVTAERELLERTLQGSIRALIDTLSLANPAAFARANRVKGIVVELLDALELDDRWEIEVAAMLSQVGAVTLPPAVAEKLHDGLPLDEDEQAMVDRLPALAADLLEGIPRLEAVAAAIRALEDRPTTGDADAPLATRVLRVALDADVLEARQLPFPAIIETLRGRAERYDPAVLDALARVRNSNAPKGEVREVATASIVPGMVLASDLRAVDGTLLVGRGQEVTTSLVERIANFSARVEVEPTVTVLVRSR
jgi:response regulator RpfG family c-di-GMP phosphodiesterase